MTLEKWLGGRWNIYPIDQIEAWIQEGRTQAWIGSQLGVNPKLIYKVCKKHGIKCQRTGPRSGPGHPEWRGGRIIDKDGYALVYCPGHPYARAPRNKYVLEHRLVMELYLNRYLLPEEVVHHKDGNKQNNSTSNLELLQANADHLRHELAGKCPKWTDEGRAKLLEVVRQLGENRKGLTRDEYRKLRDQHRS